MGNRTKGAVALTLNVKTHWEGRGYEQRGWLDARSPLIAMSENIFVSPLVTKDIKFIQTI